MGNTVTVRVVEPFDILDTDTDFKVYNDQLIDDYIFVNSKGEENFVKVVDSLEREYWIYKELAQEKSDMVL